MRGSVTSERFTVVSSGLKSGAPPARILYFEGEGFTVLDASVVVEDAERYSVEDLATICEHCLLERHPDLERGMAIAEEHGEAELVDGRWRPM